MQNLPGTFSLPFTPASFARVASAACGMLGLPTITFSPARLRHRGGFVVGEFEINNSRTATAWVTAISETARAIGLQVACAPTPEGINAGLPAWAVVLEVIHPEISAERKLKTLEAIMSGLKPGGQFEIEFASVDYRFEWIPDTALQLVAAPTMARLVSPHVNPSHAKIH